MPDVPEMASRTFRPWVPTNKMRGKEGMASSRTTTRKVPQGWGSSRLGNCLAPASLMLCAVIRLHGEGMLHTAGTDKLMEALALH